MLSMNILSKKDCEKIHVSSLEILNTLGVRIDHDEVYKKLCDAGARVLDNKIRLVAMSESLVKKALEDVPKKIKFCDRNGGVEEVTAKGPNLFWGGNAMFMVNGKKRELIDAKNFAELTRVVDASENVHAAVGASIDGFPPGSRDFVSFKIMAENTFKHLRPVLFSATGVDAMIEMAQVLLNGKPLEENPIFSLGHSIVCPLHWSEAALGMFIKSAKYKIPVTINGEPIAGGTSPVTLAGSIALSNAEILSGIVVNQVLQKGRPCIYNLGFAHVFDMRTAISQSASAECALMAGAGANLAEFYNVPSASWMSTEAMSVDGQSAYEKTMNGLMHILCGTNIIWGVGQLESQMTMSLEQVVIDNDIIGQLKRIKRGFEVNDETIAMDVIKEVGLSGDFLSHEHTLSKYKDEFVFPDLIFRGKRDNWDKEGMKDLNERAEDKVKKILKENKKEYVTPKQKQELEKIQKTWLEKF